MAISSQIRLQQLTGSLGSGKDVTPTSAMASAGSALADVAAADLTDVLQAFGDALAHIHGKSDFTNQTPGLIEHDNSSVDVVIKQAQTSSSRKLHLDSDGTGSSALDIDSAGGMDVDVAGVLDMAAGDDSVIAVTTEAKDLALTVSGGGAQVLQLNSAGTGTDAVDINATAGGIDIDANGAISIDSAAGSIDMNVVDGQTISIGLNGATEMVFTPHATPANEKISLVNTSGTADDAIKIDAEAGGLTLAAGDDSLHLDADGTDADALNIDSAGGMDVDVAGVLDINAGDDSVIAVTTEAKDLALTVSGGGAQVLQLNSAGTGGDAIDINATAGGITIDSAGVLSMDAADDVNLTLATGGSDAKDLTIASTGGGDSSVLISSAGTGADALSLDVSAGSMVIAPSLADQKTLSIGPAASTQMVFTPHDTAASEKISLVNKSGTADDAIKIDAEAGGVTIAAGNDSLVLDADGTDADAINVDSAGGIDVDAQGSIHLEGGAGGTGDITIKRAASSGMFIVSSSFGGDLDIGSSALNSYKTSVFHQDVKVQSSTGGTPTLFVSGNNLLKFGQQFDGHHAKILTIGKRDNIGGSGRNRMVISASNPSDHELAFGGTGGNMTQDIIDLGSPTEFAAFVGKDLFNSGLSIIGAFNALADGIDSNYATLYKNTVSSSNAAGVAFGVTKAVGPDSSLSDHNEARARVYLNGQLLSSASSGGQGGDTDNTVSGGDYVVVGNNSTTLRFAFALSDDDILKVVTVGA